MDGLLRKRWVRLAVGASTMLVGSGLTAGLLVLLHAGVFTREDVAKDEAISFDTPTAQKKPPARKPPPQEKPKPRKSTAPPPPSLGAALAGMSFGLPQFQGDVLGGAGDDMLGERGDAVMSEDAVDEPPRPVARAGCAYPTRARSRNISGFVTLSVLVQSDGSLSDIRVLEADPPGVFDEVGVQCIAGWRFEPATYEGRPVAVRARQTLRFELD